MDTVSMDNRIEVEGQIRYLEDQAYSALLEYGEPVRSGEISEVIGNSKYSAKLVRHILAKSPRFAQIDRRWDLEARYEDKQRTVERVLNEIIAMYGCPISVKQLATEIASVYERSAEFYEPMLERILADEERYFSTSNGLYGLQSWLFVVASDEEDDILFDNDINADELEALESGSGDVDFTSDDYVAVVLKVSDVIRMPIGSKKISYLFWKAQGDKFDAVDAFDKLFASGDLVWMSDHSWVSRPVVAEYDGILEGMADSLVDEGVDEPAAAPTVRAEVEEDAAPTLTLNISERDLDEVAQIVEAKGVAHLPAILETIFEISPRDQVYAMAAEGLSESMKVDTRFVWLGTDRWAMAGTIPASVTEVPSGFGIETFNFETAEGERIDVELDDEGLEGQLSSEINDPLVLDLNDCDVTGPITKPKSADHARLVITRHYKQMGTYPLCRIPDDFFPAGARIMQFTLVSDSQQSDIWVNRDTGIIYGMDKWYTDDMPESGAVLELAKTSKPDEFKVSSTNETDPLVTVAPGRIEDLLAMAEEAKTSDLTTFDLLCRIMRHHRKGIPFATLFTELNIVRRTTRRMAASILSSYYAFYQRPKSALWQFDEKKEDQGFKKAKRKYVRK